MMPIWAVTKAAIYPSNLTFNPIYASRMRLWCAWSIPATIHAAIPTIPFPKSRTASRAGMGRPAACGNLSGWNAALRVIVQALRSNARFTDRANRDHGAAFATDSAEYARHAIAVHGPQGETTVAPAISPLRPTAAEIDTTLVIPNPSPGRPTSPLSIRSICSCSMTMLGRLV